MPGVHGGDDDSNDPCDMWMQERRQQMDAITSQQRAHEGGALEEVAIQAQEERERRGLDRFPRDARNDAMPLRTFDIEEYGDAEAPVDDDEAAFIRAQEERERRGVDRFSCVARNDAMPLRTLGCTGTEVNACDDDEGRDLARQEEISTIAAYTVPHPHPPSQHMCSVQAECENSLRYAEFQSTFEATGRSIRVKQQGKAIN